MGPERARGPRGRDPRGLASVGPWEPGSWGGGRSLEGAEVIDLRKPSRGPNRVGGHGPEEGGSRVVGPRGLRTEGFIWGIRSWDLRIRIWGLGN